MECFDYEWITQDINNSILLKVVFVGENGDVEQNDVYQAVDVVDFVGNDVRVVKENVNDLINLLTVGTMRFKSVVSDSILDIPFNTLYKLYENANYVTLDMGVKIANRLLGLDDLNAFTIINGTVPSANYKIIATVIGNISDYLKKLIELARDYGAMGMDEQFKALSEINQLNYDRVNSDRNRI